MLALMLGDGLVQLGEVVANALIKGLILFPPTGSTLNVGSTLLVERTEPKLKNALSQKVS